ncbi:hypothetical protein HMF7854_00370 [Sphingomonas ginkgonis]|uniref:Uncharacterized protein n=1 Tax=Sphingomonas ginkgonis TaxID=2315330 RepID=A0A429V6A3_9SPHN|nr:hypothetical protein [Sphingomonas ginkgonis]RST29454.1 hypothetical protein HMF7854_00370 [Sphingomonas ginkgonis]
MSDRRPTIRFQRPGLERCGRPSPWTQRQEAENEALRLPTAPDPYGPIAEAQVEVFASWLRHV